MSGIDKNEHVRDTEVKSKKKKTKKRSVTYRCAKKAVEGDTWFIMLLPFAVIADMFYGLLGVMKVALVLLFITFIAGSIGALIVWNVKVKPVFDEYNDFAKKTIQSSSPKDFRLSECSYVYDSEGNTLAKLRDGSDSNWLSYNEIPQAAIDAFVAIEDRTFWDNPGYDVKGIIRVGVAYLKTKGDEMHGASTITQQLARAVYLNREVSLERKGKEILLAYYMTQKYSKENIMEYYVNGICYGNNIYGLEAAANTYFGKGAKECSLSQIAYLCAIPNRPTYYNPYTDVNRPIERRNKILEDMYDLGYISLKECTAAKSETITLASVETEFNNFQTTYAVDCAVRYLMGARGFEFQYEFQSMGDYNNYLSYYEEQYEEARQDLYTGGYHVYTTLNSELQEQMQESLDTVLAFDEEIDESTGLYCLQGAVTCIDNSNGKVVAVVGGRSQDTNGVYGINRAFQSYRQPGSGIKPLIVYATALEHGYSPTTPVENISVSAAKVKGTNVQELSGDVMSLQAALTASKNGVAWKLFDKFSASTCMKHLTDMHYSKIVPDDYYNSASLGGFTYGVTTVEQASGYSTLVNHGRYREPSCIYKIIDSDNQNIYEEPAETKAYKARAADILIDMLQQVPISGTAVGMKWYSSSEIPIAVKTGTTNDSKDGWLCGASPYYSMAVWVGYDQPRTLNNLWGSTYPAQIWKDCMLKALDGKEYKEFVHKEELYEEDITPSTGDEEYLPGRSDDELLSDNYYVRDYRNDRVIGESVQAFINQIQALDPNAADYAAQRESLRQQAQAYIDTIYSRSYTAEMQGALDAVCN